MPSPNEIPVRILPDAVEWCDIGPVRFTDPFFEDALRRAGRDRTRRVGPLAELEQAGGLPLCGMIFHTSRCGSTLLAQMLAASEANVVLSEPPPVEDLLRWHHAGCFSRSQCVELLRALLGALGRRRFDGERRVFLKTDCWHVRDLALFSAAFPSVRWAFQYRDPRHVLASHRRLRGAWLVPGLLEARLAPRPEVPGDLDGYAEASLLELYRLALDAETGGGLLVNYTELPDALTSRILPHWGVASEGPELARMAAAAARDAKAPGMPFAPRAAEAYAETDAVQKLVTLYERLEHLRAQSIR